jgi:hypothetical protein
MIPQMIQRKHILAAMREIDRDDVPPGRESRKFHVKSGPTGDRLYPPKYVVSLAYKLVTGHEWPSWQFSGGGETNAFLRSRGFEIVCCAHPRQAPRAHGTQPTRDRATWRRGHSERCRECKRAVLKLLEACYAKAEPNRSFDVSTNPEAHRGQSYYQDLQRIYSALQQRRGRERFVRAAKLDECDFFVPDPGFVVEFDESQHFTPLRQVVLQSYPPSLRTAFSVTEWIGLCQRIRARDNDPVFRDEQRAWYDTLRDFLPEILGLQPTVRLYAREMRWCALDPGKPEDVAQFRALIERKRNTPCGWVAVVVLQSNGDYDNNSRLVVLERACEAVAELTQGDGVILFPAGWFRAGRQQARRLYPWLKEHVPAILKRWNRRLIGCVGVDGRIRPSDEVPRDQIAVAIGSDGIVALGRKFFPTSAETGYTEIAPNPGAVEDGRQRTFELGGVRYFLCMCYDVFGVRKMPLPNPGAHVILDLAHGFWLKGEGPSGTSFFARHGFAGASREWRCPVFGTGVFFSRPIPPAWPSGVYWNQGAKSTQKWRYDDNPLRPIDERQLEVPEGPVVVRFYRIL